MQGEMLRSSRLRRETNTHKHSGKFLPLFYSLICNLPICTKYTHIHIETPCTAARQTSLSLIISWSWPRFMFIALVITSNHLIFWCLLPLYPPSFPESGAFPVSCLFASGDQNTGASASGSVLPVNIQGWSPFRLTGLISLPFKGLSEVFSSTTIWRHQFFGILPSVWSSCHNQTWSLGRP